MPIGWEPGGRLVYRVSRFVGDSGSGAVLVASAVVPRRLDGTADPVSPARAGRAAWSGSGGWGEGV